MPLLRLTESNMLYEMPLLRPVESDMFFFFKWVCPRTEPLSCEFREVVMINLTSHAAIFAYFVYLKNIKIILHITNPIAKFKCIVKDYCRDHLLGTRIAP